MKIKQVEFVKSSATVKECPKSIHPEYAFIGRSNVGKSSMINALTNKKRLAKTSSQPGKTHLLNHFIVDDCWYLVDLPGYGWAKVNKKLRESFLPLIKNYLLKSKNLACAFVLIDSRHVNNSNDLSFLDWIVEKQIPLSLIFTKIDKISKQQLQDNFKKFEQHRLDIWEYLPRYFFTSSVKKKGIDEVLNYIEEVRNDTFYSKAIQKREK